MDYEEAERIKSYWEPVVKELERRIQLEASALRICSPEELKRHQVRIKVMEELKTLPGDVQMMLQNKQA